MRKTFLFILAISLLLLPTLAYAQSDLTINELSVQLWPEYDRSDMLVMYSFSLAEDTPLPTELRVRVPANAEVNAVAKLSADTMLTVPYDPPIREGDWMIITLVIDELTAYRVEYYTPLEKNGGTRNFSFLWESDYDVNALFLEFQEPPSATNLALTPVFSNATPLPEGMTYHTLAINGVEANKAFTLSLSYEKNNDNFTVSSMPVEVGGLDENSSGSFSISESMPTVLVGVGVLLIVGGLLYFFLAGRGDNTSKESRKRHKPSGPAVHCHDCGSRARSGDKFCRSCGAKLRL
ncbi:MAG: hypothetical protein HN736_00835 [Anaerolineae bacterium]|jgi:hypothetical protein|nr:hypothetical protein [Anaerolineae bacterium]MBT3713949.1 hypothetical protein [Anaerolineae bacterium]MBT4310591.1 hypothetical protein [Anaerolineae bacterium]MBT4458994.1 hypothetical protein [Anaerolineae bacterium]MBT4842616.1 hypothetical protein [Anaerolineae bacterium]